MTGVDDYKVDFTHEISETPIGSSIPMTVLRNGKPIDITYKKMENSCRHIEPAYFPVDNPRYGLLGGMLVQNLNTNLVQAISKYNPEVIKYVFTHSKNATDSPAVVVTHVFGNTTSQLRNAAPFQIIESMNGQKVSSLEELVDVSQNLNDLNSIRFTDGTMVVLTRDEMCRDAQISCAQSFPVNRVLHSPDSPPSAFASKSIGMSRRFPSVRLACDSCGRSCDGDDEDEDELSMHKACSKCKKHDEDEDDLDAAIKGLEIHEANMNFQYCKDMSSSEDEDAF